MDVVQELEALRRERDALGRRGRGRPYPERFVARVQRVAAVGALARRQLHRELGVCDKTLAKWLPAPLPVAPLIPVELSAPPAGSSSLVVHGPAGLRIEGLDLDSLAALLRRLA